MVCAATRSRRCFLALRFNSSNSSYERERKLRSSVVMFLLKGSCCENWWQDGERKRTRHKQGRIARRVSCGQIERRTVLRRKIDGENRKSEWNEYSLNHRRGRGHGVPCPYKRRVSELVVILLGEMGNQFFAPH